MYKFHVCCLIKPIYYYIVCELELCECERVCMWRPNVLEKMSVLHIEIRGGYQSIHNASSKDMENTSLGVVHLLRCNHKIIQYTGSNTRSTILRHIDLAVTLLWTVLDT